MCESEFSTLRSNKQGFKVVDETEVEVTRQHLNDFVSDHVSDLSDSDIEGDIYGEDFDDSISPGNQHHQVTVFGENNHRTPREPNHVSKGSVHI